MGRSSASDGIPGWGKGLSWNVLALASVGIAGLLTNVGIARFWGPEGLGVFSQTLTWFIICAQIATLGIHYAVLHEVSKDTADDGGRAIVGAGTTAVLVVSMAVAAASWTVAPVVGDVTNSAPTAAAVRYVSLALVVHAVTKTLAAGLNGRRRMNELALVSSARAAGMFGTFVILALMGREAASLGIILVGSEFAAMVAGLAVWRGVPLAKSPAISIRLARFGVRAAPAAMTSEANTRVDVAMLAVLTTDRVVGIYTLAATIYEGIFQLAVVLRNQVNGSIAQAFGQGRPERVAALQRQMQPWLIAGAAALLLGGIFAFRPFVELAGLSTDFLHAWPVLIVLLVGMALCAPVLPFDQMLIVGGRPSAQTGAVLTSFVVNVAVNAVAIPYLGMIGAAIGTATGLIVLVVGVVVRARSSLGVTLGWTTRSRRGEL